MSAKLQELSADAQDSIKERWKELCPNLSEEAIENLSSAMVERVVHSRLMNDKEKLKRLHELMKGG